MNINVLYLSGQISEILGVTLLFLNSWPYMGKYIILSDGRKQPNMYRSNIRDNLYKLGFALVWLGFLLQIPVCVHNICNPCPKNNTTTENRNSDTRINK